MRKISFLFLIPMHNTIYVVLNFELFIIFKYHITRKFKWSHNPKPPSSTKTKSSISWKKAEFIGKPENKSSPPCSKIELLSGSPPLKKSENYLKVPKTKKKLMDSSTTAYRKAPSVYQLKKTQTATSMPPGSGGQT